MNDKNIMINLIVAKTWNQICKSNSLITQLFTGLFLKTINCPNCNYTTYRCESFNSLQLCIPQDIKGDITIDDCLEKTFEGEEVEYTCSSCKRTVMSKQSMKIYYLPKNLIIVFKRFN